LGDLTVKKLKIGNLLPLVNRMDTDRILCVETKKPATNYFFGPNTASPLSGTVN
jgi:hypothetical protein